jgi:hypothetical protein
VKYSPDGSRLATASWDKTVKVWDARSGAELLSLRGHTFMVTSVSYSPDGTRLATASWDQTVKVWDARNGAELLSLRGHTHQVTSVTFSPDGSRLASASADNTVKVWDARTGTEVLTLRGQTFRVSTVSYSPDGTRLASASQDGTVKVWDARSGAELLSLRGHTGFVNSVSYSPDGTRLASASQDGTVKVWDARLPAPGGYDPWAEDFERRQALAPTWHDEDAEAAEQRGDAFAAVFHRRWLLRVRPDVSLERVRLARTLARFGLLRDALDLCDHLLADQPGLAPAYLERARLRLLAGQKPAADADTLVGLTLASRSRTGWPEWAALNVQAGEAAAARGDWPAVLEQFKLALLWQAGDPELLRRVGWAHYNLKHYAAATRIYADVLAALLKLADDLKTGDRYNAACCATLAAVGQGEDAGNLDDKERARLRQQALGWLRADLALWGKQVESGTTQARAALQKTLLHWKGDSDLVGVRDAAALAKLPEAERAEWQKLWADVEATLKKAAAPDKK